MPNDDGLFTQAEVDKIVRERLSEMKSQRDTARDEAAAFKKDLAAAQKTAEGLKSRADRADALSEELATLRADTESKSARWSKEKALLSTLGEKFDPDVADVLIAKHGRAEDAGEFGDWLAGQVKAREGMLGMLLGPAEQETPTLTPGPPSAPVTPTTPVAPNVNNGAGSPPPPGPPGAPIYQMDGGQWEQLQREMGLIKG